MESQSDFKQKILGHISRERASSLGKCCNISNTFNYAIRVSSEISRFLIPYHNYSDPLKLEAEKLPSIQPKTTHAGAKIRSTTININDLKLIQKAEILRGQTQDKSYKNMQPF